MAPSQEISESQLAQLRAEAKSSLYFFCKGILGFKDFVPQIHGQASKILEDRALRRKLFELPRGFFKSSLCSVGYPLWRAIKDPNIRILIVQNTFTNATKKLGQIGDLVQGNSLFRILFPEVLPGKAEKWKEESRCLRRSGTFAESTFEAAGRGTDVTGRHYNLIIEDDTVAPDQDEVQADNILPTKEDIGQSIGYHRLMVPLLNNPAEDENLVVGTRWFEEDLISWVKEHEKAFKVYSRAAREASPKGQLEPTFPERFPDHVLDEIEDRIGEYLFSCLYMNQPIRSENMIFQPQWVRFYETEPLNLWTYTTVDLAGDPEDSKGKTDFNVVLTVGKEKRTGRIYVLDYFHERCSPGVVIDAIFDHVQRFRPRKLGVEKVGYQKQLKYFLREEMIKRDVHFLVEDIPGTKKRILGLQPLVANGTLVFRSWMKKDLIHEMMVFPYGKNDDLIDALGMQLVLLPNSKAEEAEVRAEALLNPFSFDCALEEIRQRAETKDFWCQDEQFSFN